MKVIFCDIDGVLNTGRNSRRQGKPRPWDPEAVAALNHIIAVTNAKIVVSSAWRISGRHPDEILPTSELDALFTIEGLPPGTVIGATPWFHDPDPVEFSPGSFMYPSRERRVEIAAWLTTHHEVVSWIAIDDDVDAGPEGLILTDFEQGLTLDAAELAIIALGMVPGWSSSGCGDPK